MATFARSAEATWSAGVSDATTGELARLTSGYEKDHHGEAAAAHAQRLGSEMIDRFAVVGPPEEVRDRLAEIGACGIERLIVVPGSLDADRRAVQDQPAVRRRGVAGAGELARLRGRHASVAAACRRGLAMQGRRVPPHACDGHRQML